MNARRGLDVPLRAPALPSARVPVSPERGLHAGVKDEFFKNGPTLQKLPTISPLLLRWFTWYCRGYIRRHFHSLRISRSGLPPETKGRPLVIYTNHASWWDPLIGLIIKAELFPDRTLFAPIDEAMLQRYRMFSKLGFFGVQQGHAPGSGRSKVRGAIQFLRHAQAILQSPDHLLAVTPQSRFADVRERPVRFQSGLGHLASRVEHAVFLPMATEFVFWEERLPEVLVRFGVPIEIRQQPGLACSPEDWTEWFERQLADTQDALAKESSRRDPADFCSLLRGGSGQGGIYDWWRQFKAVLHRQAFNKEHGRK